MDKYCSTCQIEKLVKFNEHEFCSNPCLKYYLNKQLKIIHDRLKLLDSDSNCYYCGSQLGMQDFSNNYIENDRLFCSKECVNKYFIYQHI